MNQFTHNSDKAKFMVSKDREGNNCLHYAAASGSEELVMDLLNLKVPCIHSRHKGLTPLHIAVKSGKASIVQLFLKAGQNPNTVDSSGRTPLHYAAKDHLNDIIVVLATKSKRSLNFEVRDNMGVKAGCEAIDQDTIELIEEFRAEKRASSGVKEYFSRQLSPRKENEPVKKTRMSNARSPVHESKKITTPLTNRPSSSRLNP